MKAALDRQMRLVMVRPRVRALDENAVAQDTAKGIAQLERVVLGEQTDREAIRGVELER